MKPIPIIVERHEDGFAAYPVGLKGVVVAEADTMPEVLAEVESAVRFHVETFGPDVLSNEGLQDVSLQTLRIAV